MHTAVMVFHPNMAQSVANKALMQAAQSIGDQVTVRDMYALYPDFHVDVAHEQQLAMASDRIVFQFPLYWYSSPALLKQWQDDVLAPGWAYAGGHELAGKHLMLAVTTGGPEETYQFEGRQGVTMAQLLTPLQAVANRVGMIYDEPFIVHGAMDGLMTDTRLEEARTAYVQRLGD
ncbi:NAD(P)H-dependent oxidoreductase [Bifidobacterium gallicum]|uniref:General stress protein 14 n=1 Tax=Bifidobacterium gallicum DSM 20093 = LMG 11596 TaxID=561180 RepID=D1NUL4_9BIFI|nr:NAD(P)H-dependent oxidoreductase [Bifidobacterium gallicum]EFA22515.1 general stress protein 14 [Bifidobacterium gallicum DSM 20093 = LMG 11596]KFI59509.1 NAD(P)H oxidoreductase [Bifidobacterium gallicum DSM 20093 = LMG 11596]